MRVEDLRKNSSAIDTVPSASLWDMGDGIALLELNSRWNECDQDAVELLERIPAKLDSGFQALVIGNDHPLVFSAGGSVDLFTSQMRAGQWADLSTYLKRGQSALHALRLCPKPVVAAVHGLTIAGGCELMLHADWVVAHAGTRMGLLERWNGILPGWGGCTQLLRRWQARLRNTEAAVGRVFDFIANATILGTAECARDASLLGPRDDVVADREALLSLAKKRALELAPTYRPPAEARIVAAGVACKMRLYERAEELRSAEVFSEVDVVTCQGLAHVLCGGEAAAGAALGEPDFMRLEHDVFLDLARRPEALARMQHVGATRTPLRN
jgi:3-hydroxyacyl-CoA dehydrogenase